MEKIILIFFVVSFTSAISKEEKKPSEEVTIKYLEFLFQRNLSLKDTMEPNITFKNLFYNQIYINLKIDSLNKEIPFYLYLQQFPIIIQSSNVSDSQVKGLYEESSSKTYQKLKESEYFVGGDMERGILSKDIFNLNDNASSYLNFYLCKENKYYTHINEGGKIGFKLYAPHMESPDASFIANLKLNNIIFSNIFSLKYNSDKNGEDTGKFTIGAYPHLYDKNHYKEEYLIKDNAEKGYSNIDWIYYFDEVKVNDELIEEKRQAFFYYEIGFIVGTKEFFDYIQNLEAWKYYFENTTKCHQTKFEIDDMEIKEFQQKLKGNYMAYYCDKDVDIENLNISYISFIKKNMNYTFYINASDVWFEKGNYKYFMIVQKPFYNDLWLFGKPFFKKYNMIFEYDNKQIGLYIKTFDDNDDNDDNDSNDKKNGIKTLYIIVFVGLLIIIVILSFALIRFCMKFPRKKRANELLDDSYEYEESEKNKKNVNEN